jgi:hypothetical protein
MEIDDCTKFSYWSCFVKLLFQYVPSQTIFSLFTYMHQVVWMKVCKLQVFIIFYACVGIAWDAPNALRLNAQDLQKFIKS